MRIKHFKRLLLIVVWQALLIAVALHFDRSPNRWIPGAFAVAALLFPFIGYIAAFYDAPLFAKWPRILTVSVLTFFSFAFTSAGYLVLFFAIDSYAITMWPNTALEPTATAP